MAATIEQLYQEWQVAHPSAENGNHRQRLEKEARGLLQDPKRYDVYWLLTALATVGTLEQTVEDKNRVLFLLASWRQGGQVPKRFLESLLRAGVYERDPDYNRWYIEPCLRCFGPLRIITRLIKYLESGSNYEKAGANNALYWAVGLAEQYSSTDDTAEPLGELRKRLRALRLREFVDNADVDVRRSLIPSLKLNPEAYPPDMLPLIKEAVRIARAHPDEYIRQRVEYQIGSSKGPLLPLPPRRWQNEI